MKRSSTHIVCACTKLSLKTCVKFFRNSDQVLHGESLLPMECVKISTPWYIIMSSGPTIYKNVNVSCLNVGGNRAWGQGYCLPFYSQNMDWYDNGLDYSQSPGVVPYVQTYCIPHLFPCIKNAYKTYTMSTNRSFGLSVLLCKFLRSGAY